MVERFTAAGAWRQAAGRRHASVHLSDDADVIEVARQRQRELHGLDMPRRRAAYERVSPHDE